MEKHQLFSLKKTEEKQLLLIMKFFSFFLLIGIGHCLATNSYSQSKLFTMKTSQKTVKQVFQEIEKNSEDKSQFTIKANNQTANNKVTNLQSPV